MSPSVSAWLGSDSEWPIHSRPEAQRALAAARVRGFQFRGSNGHTFGRLRCPGGGCVMSVYSTSGASDGSQTAVEIQRFVRRCPHLAPSDDAALVVVADAHVIGERTNHLLDSAEHLIEADRRAAEAEELMSAAESDEEAEAALEAHDQSRREQQMALVSYAVDNEVGSWPPDDGAREILSAVADNLKYMASVIEGNAGVPDVVELAQKLDGHVKRHAFLTGQLSGGSV